MQCITLNIGNLIACSLTVLHKKKDIIQIMMDAAYILFPFLDALASLDFKLSLSQRFTFFIASASTGLSELFNKIVLE